MDLDKSLLGMRRILILNCLSPKPGVYSFAYLGVTLREAFRDRGCEGPPFSAAGSEIGPYRSPLFPRLARQRSGHQSVTILISKSMRSLTRCMPSRWK